MIWVLADDYEMACHYARRMNLGPEGREWRYLREVRLVLGRAPGVFVIVTRPGPERPWRAAEMSEIVNYLSYAGWKRVSS
jgi:hypothetical protein